MHFKREISSKIHNADHLLRGELAVDEIIDNIFNSLEEELLDKGDVTIDFQHVIFISAYFLEKLERFVQKANKLKVKVQIKNVQPSIYKVFQVGRARDILNLVI